MHSKHLPKAAQTGPSSTMQRDRSATAPAPAPAPAIWGANSTCRQSDCNCQRPPRVPATHALIEMTLSRSENGRKATANDIHPPSFDCWCMSETTAQLPLFDSHRSATVRHPFGQYTDDCLVMNAALALEPAFAPLSTLAHTSCLSSAIMGKCPMVLTLRSSPQEATWTAGSGAARGGLDPSCTGRRAQAPLCAHTRNTLKPGHGGMR